MEKKFRLTDNEIKSLIEPMGGCIASDKITVEGMKIGYMYREEPAFESDSGWRFFSGTESQEYIDIPEHSMIYEVNTIANYDPEIIPYLQLQIGTELERDSNGNFKTIN